MISGLDWIGLDWMVSISIGTLVAHCVRCLLALASLQQPRPSSSSTSLSPTTTTIIAIINRTYPHQSSGVSAYDGTSFMAFQAARDATALQTTRRRSRTTRNGARATQPTRRLPTRVLAHRRPHATDRHGARHVGEYLACTLVFFFIIRSRSSTTDTTVTADRGSLATDHRRQRRRWLGVVDAHVGHLGLLTETRRTDRTRVPSRGG